MKELEIRFNMVKTNGEDFTDDEIDNFNDEFIVLVEKHNYLVGGSIGLYNKDFDECSDDDDFYGFNDDANYIDDKPNK